VAPTRRDFLKISTVGSVVTSMLGFDLASAYAEMRALKIGRGSETRSTCPYCSVSPNPSWSFPLSSRMKSESRAAGR